LFASLARGKLSDDPDERFIWLIIVGTLPAVVLALLFEQPLRENFGHPRTAALLLAANGLLMLAGEVLRRRQHATAQARLARAGATMVGGLALGLRHHEAMRYAFMLATPIIIAASLKTTPDLIAPAGRSIVGYAVLGCVLSAVAAYLSVRFLDRYFQTNRLDP